MTNKPKADLIISYITVDQNGSFEWIIRNQICKVYYTKSLLWEKNEKWLNLYIHNQINLLRKIKDEHTFGRTRDGGVI